MIERPQAASPDPADLDKVVQIEDAVWNESHAWIAEELRYELLLPGEPTADVPGLRTKAFRPPPRGSDSTSGTDFAALFGGSTLPEYRKRGPLHGAAGRAGREARARAATGSSAWMPAK